MLNEEAPPPPPLVDGRSNMQFIMHDNQPNESPSWLANDMPSFGSYASYELAAGVEKNHQEKFTLKSGTAYFSYVLAVVFVIMFFIEFALNGWGIESLKINPTLGPSVPTLISLGAKRTDLIQQGQVYRLIAPWFLHGGVLHLMLNIIGLVVIGVPLEKDFGSAPVILIFVVAGLNGMLFSAVFPPNTVGVGSSGAVFGLVGGAWAEFTLNFSFYRGRASRHLIQLLVATFIYLIFGLMPMIDNFSHLGGLVAGFLTGLGALTQNRYNVAGQIKDRKRYQIALLVFSAVITPSLTALMFVLALYGDPNATCSWCTSLSCIPFPPASESPWWTCDQCANVGFVDVSDIGNGFINITCPGKEIVEAQGSLETSIDLIFDLCQSLCPKEY